MRAAIARSRCITSVLLVAALFLAACSGGDGDAPGSTGVGDPTTTVEPSVTVTPPPAEPVLEMERFETPSHNITCQSFTASLVCVIDSGLVPEPSHDFCPVDWIGLFIAVGELSGPSCSGDPGIKRSPAPVLEYERTWSRAGVTCDSETTGLTCRDDAGNGFSLAMVGWELLGKESAARAASGDLRKLVRKEARADYGVDPDTVDSPTLRAGDDCDGLQQAFVNVMVNADVPNVIYQACFASGTWYITDGPLVPD